MKNNSIYCENNSSDSSIGLKRGTVKLVKYNVLWNEAFEKEKKLLKSIFNDSVHDIEHIGSTAVPGLMAKPIIDMLVTIDDLSMAERLAELIIPLGYEYLPEKQIYEGRIFLPKGPEERRTHHLSFVVLGSEDWTRPIIFRDYLRNNPSALNRYEEVKKSLALKYADDRANYTKAKERIIYELLEEVAHATRDSSM